MDTVLSKYRQTEGGMIWNHHILLSTSMKLCIINTQLAALALDGFIVEKYNNVCYICRKNCAFVLSCVKLFCIMYSSYKLCASICLTYLSKSYYRWRHRCNYAVNRCLTRGFLPRRLQVRNTWVWARGTIQPAGCEEILRIILSYTGKLMQGH